MSSAPGLALLSHSFLLLPTTTTTTSSGRCGSSYRSSRGNNTESVVGVEGVAVLEKNSPNWKEYLLFFVD